MAEGYEFNVHYDSAQQCAVAESNDREHMDVRIYGPPATALLAALDYAAAPVKRAAFGRAFTEYFDHANG